MTEKAASYVKKVSSLSIDEIKKKKSVRFSIGDPLLTKQEKQRWQRKRDYMTSGPP